MKLHKHNSLERKYLYHITQSEVPENTFQWQPKPGGVNRCAFEPRISRICFSTSIPGCFVTLGDCLKPDKDIHILKTLFPVHYYVPSEDEVLDAEITGEVWRLQSVKLKKIKTLSKEKVNDNKINLYDYLSFNPGIKETLSWQKTAKKIIGSILEKF